MIRNGRRCESSYQSDLSEYPSDYDDMVPASIADDLLNFARRILRCRRGSTETHCELIVPLHLIDSGEELIQQALYGD